MRQQLFDVAGENVAADTQGWRRYRARRTEQGWLTGDVPLPGDLARRIAAHKREAEARHAANALLDGPGALADPEIVARASELLDVANRAAAEAGGVITAWCTGYETEEALMAGRPRRRALAQLAAEAAGADRPRPPELSQPSKPLDEMTPAEKGAYLRQLRKEVREFLQPDRDRLLRQGRVRPRNQAELAIFAKDLLGDPPPDGPQAEEPG